MPKSYGKKEYSQLAKQNNLIHTGTIPFRVRLKTHWTCKHCKHVIYRSYSTIKHDWKGCPKCSVQSKYNRYKTEQDYLDLAKRKNLTLLDPKPKQTTDRVNWKCHTCKNVWLTSFNNLHSHDPDCKYCYPYRKKFDIKKNKIIKTGKNRIKTIQDYHYLAKIKGYTFIGPLPHNTTTKAKWKCDNGHVFNSTYMNLKHNYGKCTTCNGSSAELQCARLLRYYKIPFVTEKCFSDLRYKKHLRFDFWLPSKRLVIELQGEHHYKNIAHFSCPLSEVQEKDQIKKEWCQKNKVKMLIIPYWWFDRIDKVIKHNLT